MKMDKFKNESGSHLKDLIKEDYRIDVPLAREDELEFYRIADQMHAMCYLQSRTLRECLVPKKENLVRRIYFNITKDSSGKELVEPWFADYDHEGLPINLESHIPEINPLPGFYLAPYGEYPSDNLEENFKNETARILEFIKKHYVPKLKEQDPKGLINAIIIKLTDDIKYGNEGLVTSYEIKQEQTSIEDFVQKTEDKLLDSTPGDTLRAVISASYSLLNLRREYELAIKPGIRFNKKAFNTVNKMSTLYMMIQYSLNEVLKSKSKKPNFIIQDSEVIFDDQSDIDEYNFSFKPNIDIIWNAIKSGMTQIKLPPRKVIQG